MARPFPARAGDLVRLAHLNSLRITFTPLRSHRPAKPEKVEWADFVTVWGRRMEEAHSIEVMEVLVCASGVAYGLVLAYGIKQEWRWIFDPPEWTSVIYFPTVVKMIWGPKHVRSFAYVTAYGALVMSLICLVQSLIASLS
jgi:hypothetical protein